MKVPAPVACDSVKAVGKNAEGGASYNLADLGSDYLESSYYRMLGKKSKDL